MRVMVIVKSNPEFDAVAQPPNINDIQPMAKFNEELAEAGVLIGMDGLQPTRRGKKVRFGSQPTVIDGPFTESKELVAGYWVWKVKSIDEAVEWLKKAPFAGSGAEVEIRPLYEFEDFGGVTPAARERNARIRAKAKQNAE